MKLAELRFIAYLVLDALAHTIVGTLACMVMLSPLLLIVWWALFR